MQKKTKKKKKKKELRIGPRVWRVTLRCKYEKKFSLVLIENVSFLIICVSLRFRQGMQFSVTKPTQYGLAFAMIRGEHN